jgi:hypothetical protein
MTGDVFCLRSTSAARSLAAVTQWCPRTTKSSFDLGTFGVVVIGLMSVFCLFQLSLPGWALCFPGRLEAVSPIHPRL